MTDNASFDLEDFLFKERAEVEKALGRSLQYLDRYIPMNLAKPIRDAVMAGGKRLRPILCALAYRKCGGQVGTGIYDLGVSIELIHTYSLIHDDLPCMDDAQLRRGFLATHKIYGEEIAIHAGLVLIPAASLQAIRAIRELGCNEKTSQNLLIELNRAAGAGGMVGGQYLDLMAEDLMLNSDKLENFHCMKTGALLTASLVMGGLAAYAPETKIAGFKKYGRAVGLAFQITDDILDETSSSEDLGKNPSDGLLNKVTYVSLYGVEDSMRMARDLSDEAVDVLCEAGIESPELNAIARYIVERKL